MAQDRPGIGTCPRPADRSPLTHAHSVAVAGAAQGHAALRQWAQGYPAQRTDGAIEVGRIYYHDGVVVVEETLASPGGEIRSAASAFRVVHDHVTAVFRHDDLAAALSATELTDDDLQV